MGFFFILHLKLSTVDAGNIIYLIAIILYFLFTVLKKPKKEEIENTGSPEDQQEQRKPVSFEDLLKEIRQGQQERERDFQQSGQGKAVEERPITSSQPFERQEKSFEPSNFNQPKAYQKFQGEISDKALPKVKTLDEQVSLTASIQGIKSSIKSESTAKQVRENKYRRMLNNPSSVKDAVVLSEILNRKHF